MSRASPADLADVIILQLTACGLKFSDERKLKGIATLSNVKACHQAK